MTWALPTLGAVLSPHAAEVADVPDHADVLAQALSAAGVAVENISTTLAPQLIRYSVRLAVGTDPGKVERAMGAVELAVGAKARYTGAHGGSVGIEVAREALSPVYLRETIERADALIRLGLPMGEGVHGAPATARLADLPHLLVAGTTGSGKSVWMTSMIVALLLRNTPDDLRLTLVDPKRVELAPFADIPHLTGPIITEVGKTSMELKRLVDMMEARFSTFEAAGVRSLDAYNDQAADGERLPRHVLVIDELADLLMQTKGAEPLLVRLLQKGRAAGIHAVLATQRPDAKVLTGLIRSNVPARVVFAVQSHTDSKIALGFTGAERLRGQGDGLYLAPGVGAPIRFQAPMTSAEDVNRVVAFWQRQEAERTPALPDVAATPAPVEDPEEAEERRLLEEWRAEGHAVNDAMSTIPRATILREAGITPEVLDALAEELAERIAAGVAERVNALVLSGPNGNGGE